MKNPFKRLKPATRTLLLCLGVLAFMVGFTIAAVPLYYLLCSALGISNPGVIAASQAKLTPETEAPSTRTVLVRFVGNTTAGVPVTLSPLTTSIRVTLGQPALTAYSATNTSPAAMDGIAVHMLYAMGGPDSTDTAKYVDLQQCFCFESQHYPGSTNVKLPLSFRILPTLPAGVHTITFNYTLFEALPNDPRVKEHKN